MTMLLATFGKEIYDFSATIINPVNRKIAVNKPQHLHFLEGIHLSGITANHLHSILLAFRNPCRSHLYAVNIDITEEHAGNHKLLMRQEGDAICLLPVAQGAVHYLHKGMNPLVG